MSKNRYLIAGVCVLITVLALSMLPACGPSGGGGSDVRVGLLMSVSGVFEALGDFEKKSFDLAVEEINAEGGVGGKPMNVIFYDDEGDPAKAQQLANKLVHQDKVVAVFGPNVTPTANVACPVIEDGGVLGINFVAQEYTVADTDFLFSAVIFQTFNAKGMVDHAVDVLGAKKAGILYCDVPYGNDGRNFLVEWAGKAGLEITFEDKWGETDFDFTPQVTKAKAADMDVLFIWGSAAKADALIIKQIREGGVTAPMLGDIAITLPGVYEIAGDTMEGIIGFGWLNYGNPSPGDKRFLDGYMNKYGEFGAPLGEMCYDAAYVYRAAVERANGKTDSKSVAKAMIGLKYEGASGSYHYTDDNHCGLTEGIYRPQIFTGGNWIMQ
jgi:branched-chain amino acid transport system substrate-binding protein